MRQDLDTLCKEVERELAASEFVVFHGIKRDANVVRQIDWDIEQEADYRKFIDCARRLGIRLLVFSYQKLNGPILDQAEEQLEAANLSKDEYREFERTLRKLRGYEGFVCSLDLSFEYLDASYSYHVSTTWYDELLDMISDLDDLGHPIDEDDTEGGPLGGYYSQN